MTLVMPSTQPPKMQNHAEMQGTTQPEAVGHTSQQGSKTSKSPKIHSDTLPIETPVKHPLLNLKEL